MNWIWVNWPWGPLDEILRRRLLIQTSFWCHDVRMKLTTESTKCQSQKFNSIGPKFQNDQFPKTVKIFKRRVWIGGPPKFKVTLQSWCNWSKVDISGLVNPSCCFTQSIRWVNVLELLPTSKESSKRFQSQKYLISSWEYFELRYFVCKLINLLW